MFCSWLRVLMCIQCKRPSSCWWSVASNAQRQSTKHLAASYPLGANLWHWEDVNRSTKQKQGKQRTETSREFIILASKWNVNVFVVQNWNEFYTNLINTVVIHLPKQKPCEGRQALVWDLSRWDLRCFNSNPKALVGKISQASAFRAGNSFLKGLGLSLLD